MKIILLGSSGQLGWEFSQFLKDKTELFAFTHRELDILNLDSLRKNFLKIQPDVVINCAAYTKVDNAEKEKDLSYKINAIGAKNVAFASFKVNAKVIYFSTDYVFDGIKNSPYTEFDKPHPISVYGDSKLKGEQFTAEFNPNHLILRISWLYGVHGNNFIKTIIKLAKKQKELRIVSDQYGTPTYTLDVVKQTWELIKADRVGLYHSSNNGETTWFGFAKEILHCFGMNVALHPIKSSEYPTLAARPQYSVLRNRLLELDGIDIMRKWNVAFNDFADSYMGVVKNEQFEN